MAGRVLGQGFRLIAGMALAVLASSAGARGMSYSLIDADLPSCNGGCPKIIAATGTIQQNEHLLFSQFVGSIPKEERLSRLMVIESPGGFNIGAASLGVLLRKLKMTVIVGRPAGGTVTQSAGLTSATCASACVLVLAGGSSRFYVNGSRVGVHRASSGPEVRDPLTRELVNAKVNHDDVKTAYSSFFRQMGVDQGLASVMDRTESEGMHWLSPAELDRFRLARSAAKRR